MINSICCINQTLSVTQPDFIRIVSAINDQVRRDFAPAWQKYAVVFAGQANNVPASAWKIIVKDQPSETEQGFLGEHDVTGGSNIPEGEVLAQFSEQHGAPWSSVLSHEVLELLADEWCNLFVEHSDPVTGPQLWYREVSDPVQGDLYEDPNGIVLSNFVLPNYFTDSVDGPYDFRNLITKPFEIRPGGYAAYLQLSATGLVEKQVFGREYPEWRKNVATNSRRAKRKRKAAKWAKPGGSMILTSRATGKSTNISVETPVKAKEEEAK